MTERTITCADLDGLLLEGDAVSMQAAAAHASNCAACGETLALWQDIGETARSLRTSWDSGFLWRRIERRLEEASKPAWQAWQIAAMLAVTIGLAAAMWFAVRVKSERDAFDQAILRQEALSDVERAEQTHLAAIRKLEAIAAPQLAESDSPLIVSYKEKLMLLDDAIRECQTNIQQNRQNAFVRKQLLAVYSEKQRTLEDVLREEKRNVSNP